MSRNYMVSINNKLSNVFCCLVTEDADVPRICAMAHCHVSCHCYNWPVSTEREVSGSLFISALLHSASCE